jgi:hypothetical protein
MHVMSTSDETPDPSTARPADERPVPPAELLRTLLDFPKPKDDAWQAEAGRAVSMLAVRFLSESDDESALRAVALLGLAQSLGVKEARKRTLKLTRWTEVAPPPLTALAQPDEQRAALAGLAKLAAPWARAYAERALSESALPEDFSPDLLRWARSTFADNLSFTQCFYAPQIAAAEAGDRTVALLKEAWRLLKPAGPEPASRIAHGLAVLVDAFLRSSRPRSGEDKTYVASIGALLHLVQEHAAAVPAILLQPTFVTAFGRLSGAFAKGAASRHVIAVSDALAIATISLLAADVERHGRQATVHWGALVPAWHGAYANWGTAMAAAARATPALEAMTVNQPDDNEAVGDVYAAEAVFARLLPAWNSFVAELPDASRAASLSSMLHQAAGILGIAPLGETGAVVSYDPLSHYLVEESEASPGQVRIIRPGVQVSRSDGSARVLVAALVAVV